MSDGYAKLFASILDSTVWELPSHTRLVWVTMLAMKGADGVVEAAIPGLARRARVSIPECEEAIASLMAPDPYSRTKDFDGRRIVEVDGGWQVLNHPKYKHKSSESDRREKDAARAKAYRERHVTRHAPSREITLVTTSEEDQRKIKTEEEKTKRGSAEGDAACAADAPKGAKPRRAKSLAVQALETALRDALGVDAPALSQSLATKAAKRVTDYAADKQVGLAEAAKLLADSWASSGHANAWKLCDVPFTAQGAKRAFTGRPERSQATTGKDFADAAPLEEQLKRFKGGV